MEIRDTMLPVLGPKGGKEEVQALQEVIESGWWGKGPKVEEFEEKFAKMVGHKYAVAVTSNTAGQDLIMKALGYENIDVINPSFSFLTTAVVPLWNNCTSNIVDVKRDTLCIDATDVDKFKKPNSEMLIAVNYSGVLCDYRELRKVFGGFILEDCAHSCYTSGAGLGGDAAVWSFQAVKTLPTGDGGMITTDDKWLADRCRDMSWFGISTTWDRVTNKLDGKPGYSWDYDIKSLGYKCYMTDLTAAIGLVQIKKLSENLKFRRHIQDRYNNELHEIVERPVHSNTVQHYVGRVEDKRNYAPDGSGFATIYNRDYLINYLSDKKIHTSVHYKPLYTYDLLKQNRKYPVSDIEWLKIISLPCHNLMNDNDIDYVVYWVNEYFKQIR